jgi:predicted metal-binding membrane protein
MSLANASIRPSTYPAATTFCTVVMGTYIQSNQVGSLVLLLADGYLSVCVGMLVRTHTHTKTTEATVQFPVLAP